VADVSKAYDNVSLDLLDKLMRASITDPVVLNQWEGELMDMQSMDINVNGHIIKRTKGIPQGSKLGPLLFNFYTAQIVKEIAELIEDTKLELYIYADNWIIQTKEEFLSKEDALKVLNVINKELMKFDLEFNLQESYATRIDGRQDFPTDKIDKWSKQTIIEQIKNFNKEEPALRILGWYFTFKNYYLSFKGSKLLFNFKPGYFKTWKDAITFWRIQICSRYRYQYEGILKTKLSNLAKIYRRWFIMESHDWFQKYLNCLTIPIAFIETLMDKTNLTKEKNFIEWWRKQRIVENKIKIREKLNKLKDIANYLLDNQIYAGVYHITDTLDMNVDLKDRFKECTKYKLENTRKYERIIQVLESTYLAITREKSIKVEIFEDIELYANKRYAGRNYYNIRGIKLV
jgi:hypothetical protein